jgi:hypothetical protein
LVYGAPNRSCRARTLPVARGHAFDAEDRLRGQVIEQLMCFGAVDIPAVLERFGASGDLFAEEFEELSEYASQVLSRSSTASYVYWRTRDRWSGSSPLFSMPIIRGGWRSIRSRFEAGSIRLSKGNSLAKSTLRHRIDRLDSGRSKRAGEGDFDPKFVDDILQVLDREGQGGALPS